MGHGLTARAFARDFTLGDLAEAQTMLSYEHGMSYASKRLADGIF